MIILQKKTEFLKKLGCRLTLPLLAPVGKPATVNLPAEKHAGSFKCPGIVILFLADSVVDADVSPGPMALLQVLHPVHIVLIALETQVPPHLPKRLDIGLISPIEPVLVLDLQQDYRPAVLAKPGREDRNK